MAEKFLVSELRLDRGDIVEFNLKGNAANVMLMDKRNYDRYKKEESFEYYGGHTKKSPAHIGCPKSGKWYAIVDLGGYPGEVKASISVIS